MEKVHACMATSCTAEDNSTLFWLVKKINPVHHLCTPFLRDFFENKLRQANNKRIHANRSMWLTVRAVAMATAEGCACKPTRDKVTLTVWSVLVGEPRHPFQGDGLHVTCQLHCHAEGESVIHLSVSTNESAELHDGRKVSGFRRQGRDHSRLV